ncbi:hypothetical protein GFS60_06749 (plasmid) [Rhodococcus sp. WAY2]|nr:hypothetical protein GFS60_06749 [Rhodococcus sp. WAY2]
MGSVGSFRHDWLYRQLVHDGLADLGWIMIGWLPDLFTFFDDTWPLTPLWNDFARWFNQF